jgi:uncharacterized protein YfaP (DUF2135 family)
MPCDVRVVCRWTVDDSDVELSVRERASGAWARGLRTVLPSGGVLSRNFTSGLGPQEFVARRAAAAATTCTCACTSARRARRPTA